MQRVQRCAFATTIMLAYRLSGGEIARQRVRITVTHSQDGKAEVRESARTVTTAVTIINVMATARTRNQCQSSRGRYCPSPSPYWSANEACAPKTPSAKHDLNWTVLWVMLGSFDFPSLSFSFAGSFLLRPAGGPTFWANLTVRSY